MQTKFIELSEVSQIASRMPYISRGVWLLMNDTGLRISDAIRVKYGDIDEHGFLHYIAKKTKKNGRAKLSEAFLNEYFPEYKQSIDYENRYLFPSPSPKRKDTGPISRSTVFRHIKKACDKLGIDSTGIAPHSARKSFAVRDFREFGLGRVMHDLQHRDASTTLLYAMSDNAIQALYKDLRILENRIASLSDKLDSEIEEITEKLDILFDYVFGDELNVKIVKKAPKTTKKRQKKSL